MRKFQILSLCAILAICVSVSHAAFIVEAHSSGLASKTNFTGTGVNSIKSTAPGLMATNSLYLSTTGARDYIYAYTPAVDMDNYSPAAGTNLTNGHTSSGLMGGLSGKYNVYISWPPSTNVDAAGCDITVTNDADAVVLKAVNMNTGGTGNPGANHGWYRIGQGVHLTAGVKYTVVQKALASTFVSQRSHGVMWELIEPDPLPISITETDGKTIVTEGNNQDEYVVSMLQEPAGDTTVAILAMDPNQVALNGTWNQTILTFTKANWTAPQTVTVAAVDDILVENDHSTWLKHWIALADDPNLLFAGYLNVNIRDNEVPGVLIAQSDGATVVNEQGPTSDTYTMRLLTPPTAPVTITIAADVETMVATTGPDGATAQLTFTTANWATPQTVTVTAVDDPDRELGLNHNSTLTHTVVSNDAGYNGLSVAGLVVTVDDNDCGVWGYAPSDFNEDCQVNLEDFAIFATDWMTCSVPFIEGCTNQLAQ